MKSKSSCLALWAIISLWLFLPVAIQAAPKTLKPKLITSYQRDTNYFGGEFLERPVDTFLVQPGIELALETAKSSLLLDYTMDIYDYTDVDPVPPGEISVEDFDFVGHTGLFQAEHQPTDRLLLGLEDIFYKSREPAFTDPFSISRDRAKYWINNLEPSVFYDFAPKFTAGVRYRHTKIDFEPPDREDSKGHLFGLDLIYKFTRTLAADLAYQYWNRKYTLTTSAYDSNQVTFSVKKEFRRVTLEGGIGYHNRDFDDPTLEDISAPVYRFGFDGRILETPRSYLTLSLEQNFNDYGPQEQYFLATRLTLRAGHEFTRKLSGDIHAFFQRSDFETTAGLTPEGTLEVRQDDNYFLEGNISYALARWLSLAIGAGYEQRDSNLFGRSFDNTFVFGSVTFSYDLGSKRSSLRPVGPAPRGGGR